MLCGDLNGKEIQKTGDIRYTHGFPWRVSGKESACNARDPGLIPGSGRSSGGGHGNPLQYSCLENPTDRGTWQAKVHKTA